MVPAILPNLSKCWTVCCIWIIHPPYAFLKGLFPFCIHSFSLCMRDFLSCISFCSQGTAFQVEYTQITARNYLQFAFILRMVVWNLYQASRPTSDDSQLSLCQHVPASHPITTQICWCVMGPWAFVLSPVEEIYACIKTKDPLERVFPVGARGFEPPTSCTPCKRASRAAPRPEIPW